MNYKCAHPMQQMGLLPTGMGFWDDLRKSVEEELADLVGSDTQEAISEAIGNEFEEKKAGAIGDAITKAGGAAPGAPGAPATPAPTQSVTETVQKTVTDVQNFAQANIPGGTMTLYAMMGLGAFFVVRSLTK